MMVRIGMVLLASLAGAGLAAGSAAVDPGSASASSCSGTRYIYVPDKAHRVASMSYTECHRTVNGTKQSSTAMWLWDNLDGDGLCATGTVRIGSWSHSWSWCDATQHSPKLISGWHNGADAKVTLVA
jgi:hypothetical protein